MAKRIEVQERRRSLFETLKRDCQAGVLAPGVLLPTVRDLSERHGVSASVVFQVIQNLTEEGLVYTVPRVGTFVGRPPRVTAEPYLLAVPYHGAAHSSFWVQAQSGFEDRIAQLGGHSLVLTYDELRQHQLNESLPKLSGVFEAPGGRSEFDVGSLDVNVVCFGDNLTADGGRDSITFDDEGGAMQATQHLWNNGHRGIAFLGVHHDQSPGPLTWSARRETGWRRALEGLGGKSEGLCFIPGFASSPNHAEQTAAGRSGGERLLTNSAITAVVAANLIAAEGMFAAFGAAGLPFEKWPAVICFDDAPGMGSSVVSYLRLPWEEIGREAAQLLWERRTGQLAGPPMNRLIAMRLISRLSCLVDWANSSSLAQSHLGATAIVAIGDEAGKKPAI